MTIQICDSLTITHLFILEFQIETDSAKLTI